MEFRCRICGGQVQVDRAAGVCICEYCGTKQSIPLFSDDSSKRLYESGNNYLQHCEYDKAENVFNQLLSIDPQDAEIYWDLVMCKYGVTFVCDPRTGKYIPTCNRTHYDSVLNDKNYLNALKFSTGDKKDFYQESAESINSIQKGIIFVAKKEKPFDIFISYKETDRNGNRTKDSIVAQELYEKLVSAGYKVFFSRITLDDKIGSEYEPYIYAALSSSKVMLTVSSSKENIESPWVKNEWSRFLMIRQSDPSKELIPLYFDMPKSELPEEFDVLSAQDMKKEGFEQELLRGIKKLIPLPIILAAKRKKQRKALGVTVAALSGILILGGLISFPLIKSYIDNDKAYQAALKMFEDGDYIGAAEAFDAISGMKNAAEMKEKSLNAEKKKIEDEKDRVENEKYEAAMQLYYDGDYPQAAWALRDMNDYKDSAEMRKTAELAWRENLATVATANNLGSTSAGSYYISANGSVETFNYNPGTANGNINIDEHGKIVSIADNLSLCALHGDGYVTNSKANNKLDSDWENIIQVTPRFNKTNVALTNEGKVVYGETTGEYNQDSTDDWLQPTNEWNEIVALSYDLERFGYGGLESAALIGVKSDGTLISVFYEVQSNAESFIASLKNIKKISVNVVPVRKTVSIAAIDKDGVLYTFNDGVCDTYENLDIIDVEANNFYPGNDIAHQFFVLGNDLTLSYLGSDNTVIEDAVYINKDFIVTRSGTIYHGYNRLKKDPENTNAKTAVKDVWLERK